MPGVLPEIEPLLRPLADGQGAGPDLRQDYSATSLYQRLRDARSDARAEERSRDAAEEPGGTSPGWRDVKRMALVCLAEQSKDVEVATWLTEALVRLDGLAGFTAGVGVLSAYLRQYWDVVHPLPDEDGLEARLAPLAGLSGITSDGTLLQPLRQLPFFVDSNGHQISFYDWKMAEETAALPDRARREARYTAGILPLENLERDAIAARASWTALIADLRAASAAWQEFDAAASDRFGPAVVSTGRVADLLADVAALASRFGEPMEVNAAAPPADIDPVVPSEASMIPRATPPASVVEFEFQSREEAIHLIERLSRFFLRTEPHSPLSYALETLARRAKMPFPQLLEEVLQDQASRQSMLGILGIRLGQASGAPVMQAARAEERTTPETIPEKVEPKGIVW
jgi:type VI secretion system protein ImpA